MYELTVEPTGDIIEVEEGQTILDALLRNGLSIPYQCGHGLCSTCKVTVLDGEVDHGDSSPFALMDFERDEGVTLACCATLRGDVAIEADIDLDPDGRVLPISDFKGTVERIEAVTSDIKAIWFRLDQPLDFQAGQYVNIDVPGVDKARAFSIASPCSSPDLLEFHIRLVPQGKATSYLHEHLSVGETLNLSGPFGRFFIRKSRQKPVLLIAGGSGLSSPKSMLLDLIEEGYDQPIMLAHGVRTPADLYYRELFESLVSQHANFSYLPVPFDIPDTDDWSGEHGALDEAISRHFGDGFKGWTAYLCGPPGMIEVCIRALMKGRLFENDIFSEGFLTLAEADGAKRSKVFSRI